MTSAQIGDEVGRTLSTSTNNGANIRHKLGIDSEHGLHMLAILIRLRAEEASEFQ